MRVNPVLEGVHRRNPRKNADDAFEMDAAGAVRVGGGIKFLDEFVAEQFHAHRGDFAKFNRRAAVGVQILVARRQRVKGVAGLVQDRLHVALQADGVHENERQPRLGQRGLIAARRLAFAIVEVEQMQVLHLLETAGQFAVEPVENFLRARNHFVHLRERFQRRAVQRVHRQVPRTQLVQFQLRAPLGLQFAHDRHDVLFHRVVKFRAIFRRVIEPAQPAEGVVAVIFEAGVLRDLLAQLD